MAFEQQFPQPQQTYPSQASYEMALQSYAYKQAMEKSFVDKLLGKKEVESLKIIMKKEELSRTDLLELLYMLTGVELKLANLNEYDRYLMGKYYVWIRELVKLAEFHYDYEITLNNYDFKNEEDKEIILEAWKSIKIMLTHDVKFGVDIYLFLLRSTLGLSALSFDTLSKARYEYEYGTPVGTPIQEAPQQKTFFGIKLGGK